MPRSNQWYGWIPDLPDHRDRVFKPTLDENPDSLPKAVDLRQFAPPVMDQGEIGSCTAHGITGAIRLLRIKAAQPDVPLSRLQLYYDERKLEGTVRSDSGAYIRDGIKSAATTGVAPESDWPYVTSRMGYKPSFRTYRDAKKDLVDSYERCNVNTTSVRAAIASGFPVVFGISVFESFEAPEVAQTGMVPMPSPGEQMVGGHCMYIVGYGQHPGYFTVRNSWNTDWGDKGDCYIPYGYIGNPNLGDDYWVIKVP